MLRLAKTEVTPMLQERVIRMHLDACFFQKLTKPQIRALYPLLEATRDKLSEVLDKADGKHV
jgi:hypothetical protein